ncbi:hypothetical protein SSX86_013427 [Deinandra increscens subsp. villosa]|uniref:Glucose-induced degradation protein 4 homolog n=1 Tax=Deinandra increscens subsp. villosa TaxID=3103831 RepID=A0AAP0D646_9ASTR
MTYLLATGWTGDGKDGLASGDGRQQWWWLAADDETGDRRWVFIPSPFDLLRKRQYCQNLVVTAKMPVRMVESPAPASSSGANPGQTSLQPCSLLSVGQTFSGTQNVSSPQKEEAWRVNVRIQGCDLNHGYVCGTMEALNVPMADTPVVTFWEGEIVDTKNYTFFTNKWKATSEVDIDHWTKFPSFSPLLSQVEVDGGKSLDLSNYQYIFMRWKEQYFVNVGADCGLTIAGFYYVCFSCVDGSINGYYYDPNSSPFQKLELKTTNEGRSGFSFSSYELQ